MMVFLLTSYLVPAVPPNSKLLSTLWAEAADEDGLCVHDACMAGMKPAGRANNALHACSFVLHAISAELTSPLSSHSLYVTYASENSFGE